MIPFNESQFSLFVADHLLVGQLCTYPKSDMSLLSCRKVTQSSTSEIWNAPLSSDPSYKNRTIASTLKMQIWIATNNRDMPRVMKTKFPATLMVFGMVSNEGHIMSPHIFEVGLKVNTKVYLDVLKSVVISWCNQVAGGWPWVLQKDSAQALKSKETQAWLQKECYDFVPFSHWPPPSPIWSRWTTSFGHTSGTSPTWPPTTPKPAWSPGIRRVFTELPQALVEKACS